jgi:putative colanic acid biosynthesis acetyltransferase WcaF
MNNKTAVQNKTNLAAYDNSWFNAGAGKLKIFLWYIVNALFFINPLNPSSKLKIFLLRLFGAQVGTGVVIKPSVNIKYPWKLSVGNFTWIGEKVWIDNLELVSIADNCCLSQGCMLLTGNHNYRKSTFDLIALPITLESGSWIGAFAIVCPGVTVKSHAVLSVNSVASATLDSYSVYKGNPAVIIKEREIE